MKQVETVQPEILVDTIFQATERYKKLYFPKGTEDFGQAKQHHKAAVLSLVENIERLYR